MYMKLYNEQTSSSVKPSKTLVLNPLPDMPILSSSNSAANKDMMSKICTNWDTVI